MYLPSNSTIAETCEWLQCETGQQWSLPRLLEEGHLTPYVWIDYVEGLPLIFGNRLEGFLTKMAYHGDVIRLAADRNDALLTMFTGHDGALIRPKPGWRVELKHIRFQKPDIERVAEIINKQKTAPAQTPAPVGAASDSTAKRRTWRDVAWPYMVKVFKSGQYATAKEFYRALESKAGADSPFDNGTGANRGSLFVREISEKLTFKTIQNSVWPQLRNG